jgi:Proteasome subunit
VASLICAGYNHHQDDDDGDDDDDDDGRGGGDDNDGTNTGGGSGGGKGGGGGRIFGISPGGSLWEEDHFCVSGSGSTLLLGYLDALDMEEVRTRWTKDRAVRLVAKLLQLAMARDGSSGGLVRIVAMDKHGVHEVTVLPGTPSSGGGVLSGGSSDMDGRRVDNTTKDLEGFAKRA